MVTGIDQNGNTQYSQNFSKSSASEEIYNVERHDFYKYKPEY